MTFTYHPIHEFVWPKLDSNQCTHLVALELNGVEKLAKHPMTQMMGTYQETAVL